MRTFLKIFVYFPILLTFDFFCIPVLMVYSLYKMITQTQFKEGYTFYIGMFSLCLSYGFSQFVAAKIASPFFIVLLTAHIFMCALVSISIIYDEKLEKSIFDISGSFEKSVTFFRENAFYPRFEEGQFDLEVENKEPGVAK